MDIDYQAMGQRIRAKRKARHLTQAELAAQCNLSTSFMGHLERGSRVCSLETLIVLSDVLNISCEYILKGTQPSDESMMDEGARVRVLNDIMRVLHDHSDEWYKE